jgi:hypothetical protein
MDGKGGTFEKDRKSPRIDRLFFISYIAKEGGEQRTPVSMGRTLNISSTGIGMEVYQELPLNASMEMDIGVEDLKISVQGKVLHSHPLEDGKFYVGIQFNEPQESLSEKLGTPQ